MKNRMTAGILVGMASVFTGMGIAKLERAIRPAPAVSASADEAEIERVMKDLYACISGPQGQERDWETFDAVFTDDARMGAWFTRPDGSVAEMKMTPAEYKERSGPLLVNSGFTESEIHRELDVYGSIAHAFSTYRGTFTRPGGEAGEVSGINSVQLVKTGAGWKVHSIIWQQADEGTPIPERYLPEDED